MKHITAILFVALVACRSSSSTLDGLWRDLANETKQTQPGPADGKMLAAHAERAKIVRELAARGEVQTAEDHLHAAVILVETSDPENLELAEKLARRAAELGAEHGLRVAAEAVDKQALVAGRPQKYGTQFVWVTETAQWRLYTLDPATSDAEREHMGVPRMSELIAWESAMNKPAPAH